MKKYLRNDQLDLLLGGKWAFSARAAFVASPIVILAAPLGNMDDVPNYPLLKWILISSASVVPSALLYALLSKTIYRHRAIRPLPWWGIFAGGAILGALKGSIMGYMGYKLGTERGALVDILQKRTVNHSVVGLTLLAVTTLILAANDRYTVQRNRLLRQALSQNSFEMILNEELTPAHSLTQSRAVVQIENALEETRKTLDAITRNSTVLDGKQIAEYLRSRSLTSIRPLSHKLWESNVSDGGVRRFLSAFEWGARSLEIFPGLTLFVYFLTGIAEFFRSGKFVQNLSHISLHIVILYLTLFALNASLHKARNHYVKLKVLLVTSYSLVYEIAADFVSRRIVGINERLSSQIFDYIWVVFLIFTVSGMSAIFTREENFLISLKSLLSESELRFASQKMAVSEESRGLARYLHSNIQAALINSANLIDQAELLDDQAAIRSEVEKIKSLMRLPDLEDLDQTASSVSIAIKRVKANWDGLLTVKSKLSDSGKRANPSDLKKLETVLDEALSNAFRHGQAKKATIELRVDDLEFRVVVVDDGQGPTGGTEGMGSQTFDTVAGNTWKLTANASGGARLEMSIKREKKR